MRGKSSSHDGLKRGLHDHIASLALGGGSMVLSDRYGLSSKLLFSSERSRPRGRRSVLFPHQLRLVGLLGKKRVHCSQLVCSPLHPMSPSFCTLCATRFAHYARFVLHTMSLRFCMPRTRAAISHEKQEKRVGHERVITPAGDQHPNK